MRWKLFSCVGLFALMVLAPIHTVTAQDDPTPTPPLASFIELDDDFDTSSVAPASVPQRGLANSRQVTLVYFWAEWCEYCKEQTPVVKELMEEFGETLNVVEVDIEDAANRDMLRRYGVRAIPRLVLIDTTGDIAHDYLGFTAESRLRQNIRSAILRLFPAAQPNIDLATDFLR